MFTSTSHPVEFIYPIRFRRGSFGKQLCGSLLAGKFGLELNYWLSLLSSGIALMLEFLLIEPQKCADGTDAEKAIPFKTYVAASLRFFRKNPNVSLVMLSGMVTGASMNYVGESVL
ncbi:hypothetical protein P5G65_20185 [Paenibacillus chondroitinus]|uniref:Uncharacterized protein n=1 Tax=Paenibacillus chondroitinus TaxID=59842 RepID=A0ABU6DET9_9BACL|nr:MULTISPECIES: hypothetical protein [Paenibacillus]MCY9658547.1 hypothetical protein [Paenibacillus anseongense]MEB4796228.1 hypothetical protein [Paenibacillus chondroitinus]